MLRAVIFADGKCGVGLGHISRAKALKYQLELLNIESLLLDSTLLESFLENESNAWSKELLVIDSYTLPLSLYTIASKVAKKCMFFDDYFRLDYPSGIIVNNAFNQNIDNYKAKYKNHSLLIGRDFMLLQAEFLQALQQNLKNPPKINKQIKKILITLGGDDILNLTQFIIDVINSVNENLKIYCIHKNLKEKNCLYNLSPKEMATLISSMDLCISACGQSLGEILACGRPCIALEVAQNQRGNLEGFKDSILYIKEAWNLNKDEIQNILLEHLKNIKNQKTREELSQNSLKILNNTSKWATELHRIFGNKMLKIN